MAKILGGDRIHTFHFISLNMFGITNLPAFFVASALLIITPGADTMYILSRSITQGKKAGIYSVLGIVTGSLCHTTFAAFGLSLIVARSAVAFDMIKYAGAVYLAYLGFKMLLTKSLAQFELKTRSVNTQKVYISGILTNLLNPKVILFYLVFLPQFVKTSEAHNPVPFLILGIMFIIPGTIWCIMLAVFASKLADKVKKSGKVSLWLNRVTGGVFIALGLRLALLSKN
jgi:threonine/homoserine/homoserine lactone efflux protein